MIDVKERTVHQVGPNVEWLFDRMENGQPERFSDEWIFSQWFLFFYCPHRMIVETDMAYLAANSVFDGRIATVRQESFNDDRCSLSVFVDLETHYVSSCLDVWACHRFAREQGSPLDPCKPILCQYEGSRIAVLSISDPVGPWIGAVYRPRSDVTLSMAVDDLDPLLHSTLRKQTIDSEARRNRFVLAPTCNISDVVCEGILTSDGRLLDDITNCSFTALVPTPTL